MTEEDHQVAMDKMWPKLTEPYEKILTLIQQTSDDVLYDLERITFSKDSPITEGKKAEVDAILGSL